MTIPTANRSLGTPQGVIILPLEIMILQADGLRTHDRKILIPIQWLDVPAIHVIGTHPLIHRPDVPAIHGIGIQTRIHPPDVPWVHILVPGIQALRHLRRSRLES